MTGLKLHYLSICPINVSANTNNTALLVSEEVADILVRDLSLGSTGEQIERIDSVESLELK